MEKSREAEEAGGQKAPGSSALRIFCVILSGCLVFALTAGVRINYGLINTAISAEGRIPADQVNFIVAFAQLFYGLSQPFFGALALKKSNGKVLVLGVLLFLGGFLLIPLCTAAWMLLPVFGIMIASGAGAMAFGIVMSAVTPILGEKKAVVASGIINGSGGIGGSIIAAIAQKLLDTGGLRFVMAGLAVITAAVLPVSIWLAVKEKKQLSAIPLTEKPERPPVKEVVLDAVKSRDFRRVAFAFFGCGFFLSIIEAQLYGQIVAQGFSGTEAARAFSIYGFICMFGPMLSGWLCSKLPCKWVLGGIYALRPVAAILFLLLPKGIINYYIFISCLAMIGGAAVPPTTTLISKLFGPVRLGILSGIAFVFHQTGSFLSTWLGGVLYSASGSFTPIWLCGAAMAAFSAVLAFSVREK